MQSPMRSVIGFWIPFQGLFFLKLAWSFRG